MLTGSLSRRAGGLFESVRRLAQSLPSDKHTVHVVGIEDDDFAADRSAWDPLVPRAVPYMGPASFGFAPRLMSVVRDINPDLVHLHGIWMYASAVALRFGRESGRPLVISPRGMLDPWALAHAGFRKRVAGALYERANLAAAKCVHALAAAERDAVRAFGVRVPIAVIPNGVDLPHTDVPRHSAEGDTVLYLGRLHEKKGLLPLLEAWGKWKEADAASARWRLVLAGSGDAVFEARLRDAASTLVKDGSVSFAGPAYGAKKTGLYESATCVVLPSFSEGLPIAVLEAWAHARPVMMTRHCHLEVGFEGGAAVRVEPDAGSIVEGLRALSGMSQQERQEMGRKGLELVRRDFVWSSVAAGMASVYDWLLGNGSKPGCVDESGGAE